jgi:hypothetical protein
MRLPSAALLVVALAACGAETPPVIHTEFPASASDNPVRIGGAETPDAEIGLILAARFTGTGEHVVVLDFTPPFVKVFRRDGTLHKAFLGRGSGPLEMQHPGAVAVAGDSLILVAGGSRRVAVFTMDGQLRGEGRTGFPVLAAAAGCDGGWIGYGPTFKAGTRPAWLHRLRFGQGVARVEDLEFRDDLGGGIVPIGVAYGIAQSNDMTHVWHTLTENPSVLALACAGQMPTARKVDALSSPDAPRTQGKAARMTIEPGLRTLAGMAAVDDGVILAAQVVPKPGQPETTEFTLLTPDGREQAVSVPGSYTLRDGHPRLGVLVSTTDPAPRLFSVSHKDMRRMFAAPR